MSARTRLKRIFGGLGVLLFVLIIGYLLIRPWHLGWGASAEEMAQPMPGDLDIRGWTRAITIQARPEEIYPWLLQWGQGRGGWYSYDWLENLLGFDIHTADRILPKFQNPKIGDPICMARGVCTSQVSTLEPNRWFGWQARSDDGTPAWTYMFGLFPVDKATTRLVVRESFGKGAMPAAVIHIIEIPDVVMEQKALDTVKARAEGRSTSPVTTVLEITAWLAALLTGLAGGFQVITRPEWKGPICLGACAVLVLLVLTFMFPPLWLRFGLDAALFAGLVWILRADRSSERFSAPKFQPGG